MRLYDIGHDDGIDFLVMEQVEGESLATRLSRGPLRCDEAVARAIEIASALDEAHRQSIIHRDFKPNVMLTRSGAGVSRGAQAKLLDFGLARPCHRLMAFFVVDPQPSQAPLCGSS